LAAGRVLANAAVFSIDWNDLQLNTPNPSVPGQFYIASVGEATSRGVELEITALPHPNVTIFGAFGYTRARFGDGSVAGGMPVGGLLLPNTPGHTLTVGAEVNRPVGPAVLFVRGESVNYGAFTYDPSNAAGQDAFSLINLRAGFRRARLVGDVWIRNAFDTRYVPIAFPYPGLAPSGYIGEPGRPRTFGVSLGVTF
jgi:iron complex outermembrane receptor protein